MDEIIKVDKEFRKAYKCGDLEFQSTFLLTPDEINDDYSMDDQYNKILNTLKAKINVNQEIKSPTLIIHKPIPCSTAFENIILPTTITTINTINTINTSSTTNTTNTKIIESNIDDQYITPQETSPKALICPNAPMKPICKNEFKHYKKIMAMNNRGALDFSNC